MLVKWSEVVTPQFWKSSQAGVGIVSRVFLSPLLVLSHSGPDILIPMAFPLNMQSSEAFLSSMAAWAGEDNDWSTAGQMISRVQQSTRTRASASRRFAERCVAVEMEIERRRRRDTAGGCDGVEAAQVEEGGEVAAWHPMLIHADHQPFDQVAAVEIEASFGCESRWFRIHRPLSVVQLCRCHLVSNRKIEDLSQGSAMSCSKTKRTSFDS